MWNEFKTKYIPLQFRITIILNIFRADCWTLGFKTFLNRQAQHIPQLCLVFRRPLNKNLMFVYNMYLKTSNQCVGSDHDL